MTSDYINHSDEELIIRLRDGETQIENHIMEKYKGLVRGKARSMFLLGADEEDLIQEGMIGLLKAIRNYDSGRDASFFTFADLCVSRQMYDAIKSSHRQKHIPLNNYVSLYSSDESGRLGDDGKTGLIDKTAPPEMQNPEQLLIARENVEELEEIIEKELSGFERQVLDLFLIGLGYVEIARILGRDSKSTDNALQRIKMKLKRVL
ncbi:MAG: RNA polymerase sporulation sigma factor SigH [Lachnospiraceae bacterium]|jgi:RNA polymerase sporulation-specific sigma factor|nr:RNA polymerase sporulation sigma factor SigH [Lachnospiraceae bacterium]